MNRIDYCAYFEGVRARDELERDFEFLARRPTVFKDTFGTGHLYIAILIFCNRPDRYLSVEVPA